MTQTRSRWTLRAGIAIALTIVVAVVALVQSEDSTPVAAAQPGQAADIAPETGKTVPKDFSILREDPSALRVPDQISEKHGLSLYGVERLTDTVVVRYLTDGYVDGSGAPEAGFAIIVQSNVLLPPEGLTASVGQRSVQVSGHEALMSDERADGGPQISAMFMPEEGTLVTVRSFRGLTDADVIEISEALTWEE